MQRYTFFLNNAFFSISPPTITKFCLSITHKKKTKFPGFLTHREPQVATPPIR